MLNPASGFLISWATLAAKVVRSSSFSMRRINTSWQRLSVTSSTEIMFPSTFFFRTKGMTVTTKNFMLPPTVATVNSRHTLVWPFWWVVLIKSAISFSPIKSHTGISCPRISEIRWTKDSIRSAALFTLKTKKFSSHTIKAIFKEFSTASKTSFSSIRASNNCSTCSLLSLEIFPETRLNQSIILWLHHDIFLPKGKYQKPAIPRRQQFLDYKS